MTQSLAELEKKKKELTEALTEIDDKIKYIQRRTMVRCESNNLGKGCMTGFRIRELTYIQTHWYEEPYGCTGGDCWHESEGQWICPKCGHRNRLFDEPDIEKMKYLFKDRILVYER